MLDPLDKELEKRGHKFARYADDFTILVKSQRAGERVLRSISRFLQNRLKLVVNPTKSHVVKTSESKFLGFTFRGGRIHWHPKTLIKFKQQIRRLETPGYPISCHFHVTGLLHIYVGYWLPTFDMEYLQRLLVSVIREGL